MRRVAVSRGTSASRVARPGRRHGFAAAGAALALVSSIACRGGSEAESRQAGDAANAVVSPTAPLGFFALVPCRMVDTRGPSGPLGGPALAAGADRTFAITGACGIPPQARALAVNLTVSGSTVPGRLVLHPGGTPVPLASSIDYAADQTRGNSAIARLSGSGELAVACQQASGTAHVMIDVSGYFAETTTGAAANR